MGIKNPVWLKRPGFPVRGLFKNYIMNNNWIYPHEQLPEPESFVLATIKTEHDTWVEIVFFDGKHFHLPGRDKTDNVIAWMKKPEPAESQKSIPTETLDDQVVVRLVLAGVYPFLDNNGVFKYLIDEKGKIIGTKKHENFEQKFDRILVYIGEGQLSDEQKKALDRFNMRSENEPVVTEVMTGKRVDYNHLQEKYFDENDNAYSDADSGL